MFDVLARIEQNSHKGAGLLWQ